MEGSALAERPAAPELKEGRSPFFVDFPFVRAPISDETIKGLAQFNEAVQGKGFDPIRKGDLELSGYASTWVLDRDMEYVSRRAFDKSLPSFLSDNPIMLWQHIRAQPVGQILTGDVDDNGLEVRAWHRKPETGESEWKHDAFNDVKAGIVKTFSIGGFFDREIIEGEILIVNVDLMEISEVSIPSNPQSIFAASQKHVKGLDKGHDDPLVVQMMQLQGMVPLTDEFLKGLGDTEREHYYGRLAVQFTGQKGVEAPPLRAYAEVEGGADNRPDDETLKQVREMLELLATPDVEPQATKGVEPGIIHRGDEAPEVKAGSGSGDMITLKKGRVLSAKNERKLTNAAENLRAAADDIETVLEQVRENEEDGGEERTVGTGEKALVNDVRMQLHTEGTRRWGGERTYVYVDDFDPDERYAVFCVSKANGGEECYRVSYEQDDGKVALHSQATKVRRKTEYAPA